MLKVEPRKKVKDQRMEGNEIQQDLMQKGYHLSLPLYDDSVLQKNEWREFAESWSDLKPDHHMADGGSYRTRRYSVYEWNHRKSQLIEMPSEPHFQRLDYNPLNGGDLRYFEDLASTTKGNPFFRRILETSTSVFSKLEPTANWHIEVHQFRISPKSTEIGLPTPEGVHSDGRDFVFIMLLDRKNVCGGLTSLYHSDRGLADEVLMQRPSDSVFINDRAMFHGVSAIEVIDKEESAYRDILVITFVDKSKMQLFVKLSQASLSAAERAS